MKATNKILRYCVVACYIALFIAFNVVIAKIGIYI